MLLRNLTGIQLCGKFCVQIEILAVAMSDIIRDIGKGLWRTLNLEIHPFHFPKPITVINEHCTEGNGEYSDKSLELWLLEDIPFFE